MQSQKDRIASHFQQSFIDQAVADACAHSPLGQWYGADALHQNLASDFARYQEELPPDRIRLVELPGNRAVIAYLSHSTSDDCAGAARGSDSKAILRYRNFPVDDEDAMRLLVADVRKAIPPSMAQQIVVYLNGDPTVVSSGAIRPIDFIVAGLIDELHLPADADPCEASNLRLIEPQSHDFYEQYEQWYDEFWRRRPELKPLVQVESREDIAECVEEGGVRLVYAGEEMCAMFAAERRIEYGLTGWRMRERVTSPDFWGRGISTAFLVAFAKSLKHDGRDAIWGEIAPQNRSSLASAQRVGRQVVAGLYEL